jgi:hypothetical protein
VKAHQDGEIRAASCGLEKLGDPRK